MRKLLGAAVVLCLLSPIAIGGPVTSGAGNVALIMIGNDTKIRVAASERVEFSARAISSDRATGRTELAGDVRITVTRSGEVIVQVETGRAVVVQSSGLVSGPR